MNLGALIDLGVDPGYLKKELEKLNIKGFQLEIKRDVRKGISGTKASVIIENQEKEHHRHLHHIEDLINKSTLPNISSVRIKNSSQSDFLPINVARNLTEFSSITFPDNSSA